MISRHAWEVFDSTQTWTLLGARLGVRVAARLREVALGDDAQLEREVLQEHGREVGQQDHDEQLVAVRRPALDVRRPVMIGTACRSPTSFLLPSNAH